MAAKGGPTSLDKEQACSFTLIPPFCSMLSGLFLVLRLVRAFTWTDAWDG
jgi:hypothetical protein